MVQLSLTSYSYFTIVVGTIAIATSLYVFASLALVGMVPYDSIGSNEGFSDAFKARGSDVCQQIVAIGELLTLPVVVLISFLAQPRLQYAMVYLITCSLKYCKHILKFIPRLKMDCFRGCLPR